MTDLLHSFARLPIVYRLCDWCAIHLVGADGVIERVATSHAPHTGGPCPSGPPSDAHVARAIERGTPSVENELVDRSYMIVPLAAEGHRMGAMTLLSCSAPRRAYGAEEMALAGSLAHHGALLLGNELCRDPLGTVGHELTSPITALRLRLDRIERRAESGTLPHHEEWLTTELRKAARQIDRMAAVVTGVLMASPSGRAVAPEATERLDFCQIFSEVAAEATDGVAHHAGTLAIQAGAAVVGQWNEGELRILLRQLIDGAARHGYQARWDALVQEDAATVTLVLMGVGAEPPVDPGLALWVARRLAESMGGTLAIAGIPLKWASYTLKLPRGMS